MSRDFETLLENAEEAVWINPGRLLFHSQACLRGTELSQDMWYNKKTCPWKIHVIVAPVSFGSPSANHTSWNETCNPHEHYFLLYSQA